MIWFVACTLVLAAADPAPDSASRPGPPVSEAALSNYLQGRLLEERGAGPEALGNLYRASVLDPKSASIARRVSELAAALGDFHQSLESADRSLVLEPANPRGLWLRGTALFQLGQPDESLEALQAAVAADSSDPEFPRTLARVAEHMDRIDLVAEACRRVLELEPSDGDAYFELAAAEARLGRFTAAAKALARAKELVPFRPGVFFLDGLIQEGLGDAEGALALYRRHLEFHPSDLSARARLVPLLAHLERWSEAYREVQPLAAARPADRRLASMVVDLAYKSGHRKDAERGLESLRLSAGDNPREVADVMAVMANNGLSRRAVEEADGWAARHPDDARGAMLSARARALAGKPEEGIPFARRAVEMAPDSIAAWVTLGRLHADAKRHAEATRVWRDAAAHFPDETVLALEVSFSLERAGDIAGAEQAVRDVLARWPEDASALNSLGYLLADQNRDLEVALRLIQRAIEQDPDNGAYVDSLGWAYFRLGRLAEARETLERAVHLTGGDPIVREHLGDVYKELQLNKLANDQYRLSLAGDTGNARVRAKLTETR